MCFRFLVHFEASTCLSNDTVPVKHVPCLLNEDEADAGGFSDENNITINLITGVPGSHQQRVCESIAETLDQSEV